MSRTNEAAQLHQLTAWGIPADVQARAFKQLHWSPGKFISNINEMFDSGIASEAYLLENLKEFYPELFLEATHDGDGLLSLFRPLTEFELQKADWLVTGLIPKGAITTLSSDGGLGKTSAWVNLAAAISSGSPSFLDTETVSREPGKVLFLSTEDSIRIVLKRRLQAAGANEANILAPDFSGDQSQLLRQLKFGSQALEQVIASLQPTLCIFDPLQAFVPQGCQMGDRAQMRDCLAPLITWGEKFGTTFLIICHTNKRDKASGRDRIADSADLWDISRSVLMMGWTPDDGIRYLSHEKSSYGEQQESILFTIDREGIIHTTGRTWKRDRDYRTGSDSKTPTKREDCRAWLVRYLEESGGEDSMSNVYDAAAEFDYSDATLRRAKESLAKENKLRTYQKWVDGRNSWYMQLTYFPSVSEK